MSVSSSATASGRAAGTQRSARYLDCGIWEQGFVRVRCGECRYETLVPFSCKQRELCPSCAAKRGCELAAFLADHVLEDVAHAQWVFTIPKMQRPLFFRRRELRGVLARLAWETVRELMAAAVEEPQLRPGMVSATRWPSTSPRPLMPKQHRLRTPRPRASDGQICSAVSTKSILWSAPDAPAPCA